MSSGSRIDAANPSELSIDWTHYHNHAETVEIMKSLAEAYPNLSKVYTFGKSFQGADLWLMEITNTSTGAAETKPGMWVDGNTHAGEVSGAEVCLYTIHHLLTNYGKDDFVTRLLDDKVFYIVPKLNPDGSDAYLRKPGAPVDPNLKKVDDDKDGLLDEDGAEDLNGDGIITLMRIRDEKGPLKTSPNDPRLMVERKIDEKGEWRIIGPEGIDNDDDGRINEDPPGSARTVSNRNFHAWWAPEWIQSGSGPYPLSEPETKALVDFILAHPNIAGLMSYHTHSGVLLRPFVNRGDDDFPPLDLRNYEAIGAMGTEVTGYPLLSIFNDFTSNKANPRHGSSLDWAYEHLGLSAFGSEIWKAPGETGRSAFEGRDYEIAMKWNDEELDGKGFINWAPYDHPQHGAIEIGGWNNNYFTQNPPAKFMEAEWKKCTPFDLKHADMLPLIKIADVEVASLGDNLICLKVTVENEGFLPTNVTQKAIQNGVAKPVTVKLELDKAELLMGDDEAEIGHIKGLSPLGADTSGRRPTRVENKKTVEFLVRTKGKDAKAKITAISEKAGTKTKEVDLAAK
jgi:hypothetical protein